MKALKALKTTLHIINSATNFTAVVQDSVRIG